MTQLVCRQLAQICAAVFMVLLPACAAQSAKPRAKPEPKPEPTAQELFEYVRSALILLSPDDGINDNLEVTFNQATSLMTVTQPNGHCDQYLNTLDANNSAWDVFDPSDAHESREPLLRLTLVSVSGKTARICYDKENKLDASVAPNRVRLLFSQAKAAQWPNFQEKLSKAFKNLIVLSGAAPENDIFSGDPKLRNKQQ
jgi:hypothetical protein